MLKKQTNPENLQAFQRAHLSLLACNVSSLELHYHYHINYTIQLHSRIIFQQRMPKICEVQLLTHFHIFPSRNEGHTDFIF